MFNVLENVIYRHEVCIINEKKIGRNDKEYYVLVPIFDNTLKIEIPVVFANKNVRRLISKEDALELIKKIPLIDTIDVDSKLLESEYKKLLSDNNYYNLVRIIKTTYLRNKERLDNKKRLSYRESYYFELAEKYLYNELSLVFNMSLDETKKFVFNEVEKISNNN